MPAIDFGKPKRKSKRQKPDEIFTAGPIALARYGRLIVAKNVASAESNEEIQKRIPNIHRDLEEKIASEISALRTILAPLDPLHFLHQAFGEFFVAHRGYICSWPDAGCQLQSRLAEPPICSPNSTAAPRCSARPQNSAAS